MMPSPQGFPYATKVFHFILYQNHIYCQASFNIQGVCLGVVVHDNQKIEDKRKNTVHKVRKIQLPQKKGGIDI